MPANLNDDLAEEEKGPLKITESTENGVNCLDVEYTHIKSGLKSLEKAENMEPRVFTKYSISKLSAIAKLEKEVDGACTNKLDRRSLSQTQDIDVDDQIPYTQNEENTETKLHDIYQDMSSVTAFYNCNETNSDESCNVNDPCGTLGLPEPLKNSADFQNENKPVTTFDAKLNPELQGALRNGIVDDSNREMKISYSESGTTENSTNSSEENIHFQDPSVPKYFMNYVEGLRVCGDSRCPLDSKPSWLDVEKFKRGQKVAMKYLFGIQFAQLLSLLIVLNGPGGVEPLIFTGKSDTPFKAFKRYLSTALKVRSWYLDDLWDPQTEGHKNLKTVRKMHENLRKSLIATDPKERDRRSTLSGRYNSGCPAIWSTLHNTLREDFEGTCSHPRIFESEFKEIYKTRVFVNQSEMSITQFGFVGLFIKYPAYFGAHYITEDELDSFVHLWRCIGYLLGVEDKFNFCNGDLQTVTQKSSDLIELVMKPSLRIVTQDWEHMTRCIAEGISYYVPGVTFEVSLLYLCNMLGLYTPRLWKALTFKQKIFYYLTQFTFWFILRLPGSVEYHSRLVQISLKRGENASMSKLKQWEEKKYPYQELICTKL